MAKLSVLVLGTPRVEIAGAPLTIRRRKVVALLAYLSVTGRPHSREVLAEFLFPGRPAESSKGDLRQTLSFLRDAIGVRLLTADRDVGLSPQARLFVDAAELRRVAGRLEVPGEPVTIEALTLAAGLYRGDFLSGFHLGGCQAFEEWQRNEQESLRQEVLRLLARLVQVCESRGQPESAIQHARRWIGLDPLDEGAHRSLMRLYARTGQRGAALQQYEECRSILARELDDSPDAETESLAEAIRSRQLASAPGVSPPSRPARMLLRTAAALSAQQGQARRTGTPEARRVGSCNLPSFPTTLVGRDREIAEVRELLTRQRVLTLTGPGGAGKTRVAVQAAADLADFFGDGVCFVDLSPVRHAGDVMRAIASALRFREPKGEQSALVSAIAEHIRSRRMLLLLDNFEQVASATPALERLVAKTTRMTLLLTSRRSLKIDGGAEYPLPRLGLPPANAEADEILSSDAVRLLALRAMALGPDFALARKNAATVREICTRLDGLPLAIELAAPWLRLLSPADLLARLSNRLRLLAGTSTAVPARQRTLRATLEWSHDLLAAPEKRLFARIGVFCGGASVEAIEEICGDGSSGLDTLHGLAALVEHNLLRRDETAGESRLSMLETIREYSRERLAQGGEAAAIEERHARHYLRLAQQGAAQLFGPDESQWIERIAREEHNLRQAMAWFLAARDAAGALALGVALRWFWFRWGRFVEGEQALERSLSIEACGKDDEERGKALDALGWMVFVQGDWGRAKRLYEASLAVARKLGARLTEAAALSDLGVVERWLYEDDTGTRHCEEAVSIARELGDPKRLALALIWGYGTTGGRPLGRSPRSALEEALHIAQKSGNRWAVGHALGSLGDLLREAGDLADASSRYASALGVFRELGDRMLVAATLEGLGATLSAQGDYARASAVFAEGLEIARGLGDKGYMVQMVGRLALVARSLGQHDRAAVLLGASTALRDVLVGGRPITRPSYGEGETRAAAEYQAERRDAWYRGLGLSCGDAVELALQPSPAHTPRARRTRSARCARSAPRSSRSVRESRR